MNKSLTVATLWTALTLSAACGKTESATNQTDEVKSPSRFRSLEDGQFDVSGFLDEKYGFLPIALPITEPAVGYGAAVGLAFMSAPLAGAEAGHGRPPW